jgi:hypothetical protein
MGISPNCWGPYVWAAIHLICFGAPDQIDAASKTAYATFFNQLPYVIPCATCAQHLQKNLAADPVEPHLNNKEHMFQWSVRLHNTVNKQLGKPEMSLEHARVFWSNVCTGSQTLNKTDDKPKTNVSTITLFVVGILIGAGFAYSFPRLRKGLRKN